MNSNIDVIIPTYNRRHTLGRSIDSVLTQSLKPAEIIIVDDGSNKETKEVLSKIKHPSLKIITQQNKGLSCARNRGFKDAKGILEGLSVLEGDIETNIDSTYDLVQEGLNSFKELILAKWSINEDSDANSTETEK